MKNTSQKNQVLTFLDFLNKNHNLNHHLKDYLPVETITLDFLTEENILIANENGEITFLDTTRISKSYLDLNSDIINAFSSLESLICKNLRGPVDCSGMQDLKSLKLGMANRHSSIYIAENKMLNQFEVIDFDPNDEDQETTKLLIHPNQVGKSLIPINIEKLHKDSRGNNVILVSIAPPGHKSMKFADKLPAQYIWRFNEAELADILEAYWSLQPEYYTQYATVEECPNFQQHTFLLLKQIEDKVLAGAYENNISFDIKEKEGEQFEWREFHDT